MKTCGPEAWTSSFSALYGTPKVPWNHHHGPHGGRPTPCELMLAFRANPLPDCRGAALTTAYLWLS